jgi:hypothetical protein
VLQRQASSKKGGLRPDMSPDSWCDDACQGAPPPTPRSCSPTTTRRATRRCSLVSFLNASCCTAQTVAGLRQQPAEPVRETPVQCPSGTSRSMAHAMRCCAGVTRACSSPAQSTGGQWCLQPAADPDSVQAAYALVSSATGVQNPRWTLTFFGNNLLDKRYALTLGRSAVYNVSQTAVRPTQSPGPRRGTASGTSA